MRRFKKRHWIETEPCKAIRESVLVLEFVAPAIPAWIFRYHNSDLKFLRNIHCQTINFEDTQI